RARWSRDAISPGFAVFPHPRPPRTSICDAQAIDQEQGCGEEIRPACRSPEEPLQAVNDGEHEEQVGEVPVHGGFEGAQKTVSHPPPERPSGRSPRERRVPQEAPVRRSRRARDAPEEDDDEQAVVVVGVLAVLADTQGDEDRRVDDVVRGAFVCVSERAVLELQPGHFTVASIENLRAEKKERTETLEPVCPL